ncbi:hypothetical protein Ahy_B06g084199 [Arachis hypogaea]|uniref:SWIM-type domain-containing protein n=1 Tax=Arachis hypogaea TaxID=3818 RepID=A0A444YRD2_ARAHY|nr:hypothetical protein Ahy_B06g084199 [Arachis hypogaea]
MGIISDRYESIRTTVNHYEGDWKPPRAWWTFCIRHIGSNFLRAFKVSHLQNLVVNIGYSWMVEEYNINYKRLQERGEKSADAHDRKRAGLTYIVFSTQRIEANMQRARNIVVHRFDRQNEVFEVCKMPNGKVLIVDLVRRTCDCEHFQVERLSCHHVIACCANQRLNWQLYVNDVYKMTEVHKVYKIEFVPLGDPDTWPAYS